MRTAVVIVSFVLISANVVCASDRVQEPSVAAEGAAWIARMRPPAQDDRPIAAVLSGELYVYSTAKKLNCKAGLLWMTQLAEAGNAEAMFELGELYETGSCVQANEPIALAWFLKAAENGSAAATSELGKLYLGGEGIAPDYKEALRWLSRGVILLDRHAFYYLGLMYQKGMGVRPNYKEAYKLLDVSMRLSPFFSGDRKTALVARDATRERLTPREVADAASASKLLLIALLESDDQSAHNLLPQEVLTTLHVSNR